MHVRGLAQQIEYCTKRMEKLKTYTFLVEVVNRSILLYIHSAWSRKQSHVVGATNTSCGCGFDY